MELTYGSVKVNGDLTDAEVWLKAWLAYASSSNSLHKEFGDDWADHCLASYRKRFPIAYFVADKCEVLDSSNAELGFR